MSRFSLNKVVPGALIITGDDGRTRFNSNDGLFHTVNPISGSITIPTIIIGDGAGADRLDSYTLGFCTAGCTDVIGMINAAGGAINWTGGAGLISSSGINGGIWQTVMGGSAIVFYQDGHGPNSAANPNLGLYQMGFFWIDVLGTVVRLNRRLWVSKSAQGSMTINPITFSYRLKAGLYT